MRNNSKPKDLVGLVNLVNDLEKEYARLERDNEEMRFKLKAKRYKAVDSAVDFLYKVIRAMPKSKKILEIKAEENKEKVDKKYNIEDFVKEPKRIQKGRVDIININFFDWDGKVVYKGGAERYVYDLACLLVKMGFSPRILQCSNIKFEKNFGGIPVIGIGAGSAVNMRETSRIYNYYCIDSEFVIASPLELACEIISVPVIGINHGINFDGETVVYRKGVAHCYDDLIDALINVKSCICVDTNFINWTRTQDYKLSLKEIYIPNYCDVRKFERVARKNRSKDNSQTVFVYPRRICSGRGYDITIDSFREVFDKYKKSRKNKIILKFVGQIYDKEAEKALEDLMNDFPKNVFHYEYDMNEMPKAYEGADVVLIPTKYSEGTSLSCIEAMAAEAMIISTNVGGLPNLVIDGFNGRLISPTKTELINAVVEATENQKWRKEIAMNGFMVAKTAFGKGKWEDRWIYELKKWL